MTIGQRIKARRKELGLSAEYVASRLGKNRATVYRYENDDIKDLPITILEPLASILRTTPADLMGFKDQKDPVYPYTLRLDETRLLSYYNKLNDIGMEKAMEYVQDLSEQQKYIESEQAGVGDLAKKENA